MSITSFITGIIDVERKINSLKRARTHCKNPLFRSCSEAETNPSQFLKLTLRLEAGCDHDKKHWLFVGWMSECVYL
jgi:hypothetical protein